MIDNQYSYYQMYSVGGIENIGPGYSEKHDFHAFFIVLFYIIPKNIKIGIISLLFQCLNIKIGMI